MSAVKSVKRGGGLRKSLADSITQDIHLLSSRREPRD